MDPEYSLKAEGNNCVKLAVRLRTRLSSLVAK